MFDQSSQSVGETITVKVKGADLSAEEYTLPAGSTVSDAFLKKYPNKDINTFKGTLNGEDIETDTALNDGDVLLFLAQNVKGA